MTPTCCRIRCIVRLQEAPLLQLAASRHEHDALASCIRSTSPTEYAPVVRSKLSQGMIPVDDNIDTETLSFSRSQHPLATASLPRRPGSTCMSRAHACIMHQFAPN